MIEQGAYMLIAAGAFIFLVSFLGYCGAIKESRVLLTAYGLFIIIVAVLQVAFVVVAAINQVKATKFTKDFFHHTLRTYYTTADRKDAVTLSWDFMMAELECCGVDGHEDFQQAPEFVKYANEAGEGQVVPAACCKLDTQFDLKVFKPQDPKCLTNPSTYNSNMHKVN